MKQFNRLILRSLILLLLLIFQQALQAATIEVNTTKDKVEDASDNETCSLREAIIAANEDRSVGGCIAGEDAKPDEIIFADDITPGTIILSIQGIGENRTRSGDLDITSDLTITGRGASQTVIDGGQIDRVFDISPLNNDLILTHVPQQKPRPRVQISGVTIQNGNAQMVTREFSFSFGGGIANSGDLILEGCLIKNSIADFGGGVFNGGLLTIDKCSIQNNNAELAGGGIINVNDNLLIKSTTISDNRVNDIKNGIGGGIASSVNVELINSTISGNSSARGGGIFNTQGIITLTHITIANNEANIGGGLSIDGSAVLHNSMAVNNKGGDCEFNITSLGGNLDSDRSCGLNQSGDLPARIPLIGPLQDNEGPTFTHALLAKSPAINAVLGDCTVQLPNQSSSVIDTDQRGITRPRGQRCDIGAFEAKEMANLAISVTSNPAEVQVGENISYDILIRNTGQEEATEVVITNTLPSGVIYQTALSSPECIEQSAEIIRCTLETVAVTPDQPTALQIVASPSLRLSGEINNTVTIRSAVDDPDLKNNSDTTQTQVIPLPPAASIEVNTTADKLNDISTILVGERCSLREAIVAANEDRPVGGCTTGNGADKITFAAEVTPGIFLLSIADIKDENLTRSGDLDIFSDLTIQGNGSAQTIIDAAQIDRVFHITDSANVVISGVSIQNGNPTSVNAAATLGGGIANNSPLPVVLRNTLILNNQATLGGGVYSDGIFTVENSLIENNIGFFGAGMYNNNRMTVKTSTIRNNSAATNGGGIYNSGDTLILTASTLNNNQAQSLGGGITNFGLANLSNSTISGNTAARGGGIFDGEGDMTVTNTTIANNEAVTGGGLLVSGIADLRNSIVANNIGGDCDSVIRSSGGNLDSDDTCGLDLDFADLPATDPLLGSLQLNGGLTFTHALLQGSPAIDAIPGSCVDLLENTLPTDQRGVERTQPQEGDCDIGAYEARIFSADLSISITDSPDPVFAENNLSYAIRVENTGPDDANDVSVINTLPSNVLYQAALSSPECIQSTPETIICNVGTLRVDDDAQATTLQIVVTPSAKVSGSITNTVTVGAIEFDPEPDNNIETRNTDVISLEADLSISKSITRVSNNDADNSENAIVLGSVLEYTLSITNEGPRDATGITISDVYERFIAASNEALNVTVVSVESVDMDAQISNCKQVKPDNPGSIFSCTIAALAVNQTVSMTIAIKPLGAGTLVNTTSVTANETDSDQENNIASITTQISPPVQLNSATRIIPSVYDFPDNPLLAFVLVGSPLNLQMPQASSVLQTFGGIGHDDLWRLFRFNPDSGEYNSFAQDNTAFNFLPHQGFWLIVRNTNSLVLSGTPNDANVPYNIPLKPGLQQITTPFNFPPGFLIDWNTCVVPLSNGISGDLFDFDGTSGGYISNKSTKYMHPMHGYWVFADTTMTLTIPPDCVTLVDNEVIESIQPRTRAASSIHNIASTASVKWRVKLSANIGALTDTDNFIGADSSAIDAYDVLDIPEPPAFHRLSLSFVHPEWNKPWTDYASDIRSIKSGATTWDFIVKTGLTDSKTTLRWRFSGICAAALTLRDKDANQIIDMSKAHSYDFYNHKIGARHFEITANWLSCL